MRASANQDARHLPPVPAPGGVDEVLDSGQGQSSERRGGRRSLTWASPARGAQKDARRPRGSPAPEPPPERSRSAEVKSQALIQAEVLRRRQKGGRTAGGGPRGAPGFAPGCARLARTFEGASEAG